MVKALNASGLDALAWNFRGCGGEINRRLRFYHSGETGDLGFVVDHIRSHHQYENIGLIGFSLGGNVSLKYLGELGSESRVDRAVTFSVPLDLHSSCIQIGQPSNYIYARRFLMRLKEKVTKKDKILPGQLAVAKLPSIKTIFDFDDQITAPIHGFEDAIDYYSQSSSINFLSRIKIPTLIVNALNDPFLPPECYPNEAVSQLAQVFFESPAQGGHVGFATADGTHLYWSEKRAIDFLNQF